LTLPVSRYHNGQGSIRAPVNNFIKYNAREALQHAACEPPSWSRPGEDAASVSHTIQPARSTNDMTNHSGEYWKANIRLVTILLIIWFTVSYLFGIILVEPLNTIRIGGVGLGFWFAQQGSIFTFLILIFVYAIRMNTLDRKFNVHED
jgi:putative solute:sodium symporter small subunit